MYEQRFYRQWMQRADLARYRVLRDESDLMILSDREMESEAREALDGIRDAIEEWIAGDPGFREALGPVEVPPGAPDPIRAMARAAGRWNVGPMAAVAGAVARAVGERLARSCETVIVENGGDVWVRAPRPVGFNVYAGEGSPFSDRIGFEVDASEGLGVCTSSGVVGPSLSLGRADAVVVVSPEAEEADAAATSLANRIRVPADVQAVVEEQARSASLAGVVACAGDRIGFWGDIRLVPIDGGERCTRRA